MEPLTFLDVCKFNEMQKAKKLLVGHEIINKNGLTNFFEYLFYGLDAKIGYNLRVGVNGH